MTEGMYNAADPASIRSAAKAARQADRTREEILRGIMSVPPGRAWVFALLETCHVFRTTYTGDGLSAAFKEGERNIGLRLLSDVMAACPDQFILAMREHNERSTNPAGRDGHDRRPEGNGNGGYTTAESDEYAGGDDICGND